ncbi:hypothetical protein SNE40_020519 [Patella caerulea]|uniref:Uncharacterized protein n=1 Tax=Patella caerulea TaxID=87958 RepID=A0AAN8IYN3_PATCE
MTARGSKNIASLVLSSIILAAGVSVCVLLYELVKQIAVEAVKEMRKQDRDNEYSSLNSDQVTSKAFDVTGPFWLLGFGFILPGISGLFAAIRRTKCSYIIHMVFGIKALLVMGIFFVIGIFALGAVASHHKMDCKSMNDMCMCRSSDYDEYQDIGLHDCKMMYTAYNIGMAIVIIIVIGWILLLTETVIAGTETCKSSQTSSQGAVIVRAPVQTTFVRLEETAAPPAYNIHDKAVLVKNC